MVCTLQVYFLCLLTSKMRYVGLLWTIWTQRLSPRWGEGAEQFMSVARVHTSVGGAPLP